MRAAARDLLHLWRSRHEHSFPWPFNWFGGGVMPWITGYWRFSPVPLWKQLLNIPLRPYRYARMVRGIARTRAIFYHPSMEDDVP
jgi:hypothetical protein